MATKFTVNPTPDLRSSQKGGLVGNLNSLFLAPLIRGVAAVGSREQKKGETDAEYRKMNVPFLGEYERPVTQMEKAKALGGAGISVATDLIPMLKAFGTGGKLASALARAGANEVVDESVEQLVKAGVKDVAKNAGKSATKNASKIAELPVPTNLTPTEQAAKEFLAKRMADPTGMIAGSQLTPEAIDIVAKGKQIGKAKNVPAMAKNDIEILQKKLTVPKAKASSPKKPLKKAAGQQQQPNVLLEIMQEADDLETMQLSGQDVSSRVQKLRERLMTELEQYPLETRPSLLNEFLQKTGEM